MSGVPKGQPTAFAYFSEAMTNHVVSFSSATDAKRIGIANENETREIPLKIYQTWKTKNLPEKMHESVNRLKEKNPEFEYNLFDDNECYEFIKANFNDGVAEAYNKIIPGAYKADLWRYCVLYVNGGVYLDIKYSNVGDFRLKELTDKEYFMADLDESGSGIYNAFMICKAGNPKLRKAIEMVTKNVGEELYGDGCLSPTGPVLLRKCFTPFNVY